MILLLITGLIILIVLIIIYYFNKIIVLQNNIKNAYSQIDVQLKKRADLVPNLVETVKGYAKHEKNIFLKIAEIRKEMINAKGVERLKKGEQLQKLIKSIFAIAENYPQLKASENFKLLQEQLQGIENKIAAARQFYNDSVLEYNNFVKTFPGNFFAKIFNKNPSKFIEITNKERELPKVKF